MRLMLADRPAEETATSRLTYVEGVVSASSRHPRCRTRWLERARSEGLGLRPLSEHQGCPRTCRGAPSLSRVEDSLVSQKELGEGLVAFLITH